MKLFLDDIRVPEQVTWVKLPSGPWTIVRSYNEFVKEIRVNGVPDFIALDHDLAEAHYEHPLNHEVGGIPYETYKEKTGYDCAKWLLNYCDVNNLPFPKYVVHSLNPVGKKNIQNLLG